jgi:hypothetical protein
VENPPEEPRSYKWQVVVVAVITVLAVAALAIVGSSGAGQSQTLSNDELADTLFPGDLGLKTCVSEQGTLPGGDSYNRTCHLSRACSVTSGVVTERAIWVRLHGRKYDVVDDTGPGPC